MYKAFVLEFDCPYDALLCSSYYNLCRVSKGCYSALNYDRFLASLSENFELKPSVLEHDPYEVIDPCSCFVELFVKE